MWRLALPCDEYFRKFWYPHLQWFQRSTDNCGKIHVRIILGHPIHRWVIACVGPRSASVVVDAEVAVAATDTLAARLWPQKATSSPKSRTTGIQSHFNYSVRYGSINTFAIIPCNFRSSYFILKTSERCDIHIILYLSTCNIHLNMKTTQVFTWFGELIFVTKIQHPHNDSTSKHRTTKTVQVTNSPNR